MNRSLNYYREQRRKHIKRKKRIIKDLNNYWYYKHDGELSKGKIHCSCKLCRAKSRENGPKFSDLRKLEAMKAEMKYK